MRLGLENKENKVLETINKFKKERKTNHTPFAHMIKHFHLLLKAQKYPYSSYLLIYSIQKILVEHISHARHCHSLQRNHARHIMELQSWKKDLSNKIITKPSPRNVKCLDKYHKTSQQQSQNSKVGLQTQNRCSFSIILFSFLGIKALKEINLELL